MGRAIYFATAIAATCVLSGIFAARTLNGAWTLADNRYARRLRSLWADLPHGVSRSAAALLVPALYLAYGLSVIHLPTDGPIFGPLTDALGLESSYGDRYAFYDSAGWVPGYATIGHVPTQDDIDAGWRIVERVRADDRPALSEEAAFSLHADKDVDQPHAAEPARERPVRPDSLIGRSGARFRRSSSARSSTRRPSWTRSTTPTTPPKRSSANGFNYGSATRPPTPGAGSRRRRPRRAGAGRAAPAR